MSSLSDNRYLLVGLGNPGAQYVGTRHNIGMDFLQRYATEKNWPMKPLLKVKGKIAHGKIEDRELFVLLPMTYMNLSGQSVSAALQYYKIAASHLLVLCDDADLAFGALRLRQKGGSGGHNGLADIAHLLGSQDYARLRIGIGRMQEGSLADFVLAPFSPQEKEALEQVYKKVEKTVDHWLLDSLSVAMQYANN